MIECGTLPDTEYGERALFGVGHGQMLGMLNARYCRMPFGCTEIR